MKLIPGSRSRTLTLVLGLVLGLIVACTSLEQSITLQMIYPTPDQTRVTIYYTVADPPPGKTYVLWIVNPDQHQAVNAGQVSGGRNQVAQATVQFMATGAVVSIEDSATPASMSNTWALKVGEVTPTTPTPRPTGPAGTPATNPNAGNNPNAGRPFAR